MQPADIIFLLFPIPSAIKTNYLNGVMKLKKTILLSDGFIQKIITSHLLFLGNAEINQLNLALNLMKESLVEVSSFSFTDQSYR